jgi:hypothetical protein
MPLKKVKVPKQKTILNQFDELPWYSKILAETVIDQVNPGKVFNSANTVSETRDTSKNVLRNIFNPALEVIKLGTGFKGDLIANTLQEGLNKLPKDKNNYQQNDNYTMNKKYSKGGWLDSFKPPKSRIEAETKLDALNNRTTAEKWLDASKPIMKEANNTSEIYQTGVNKGKPTGKGALEPVYPEMLLMPGSLPIKATSKLGKVAVGVAEALNPIGGMKSLKPASINSSVDNVGRGIKQSSNKIDHSIIDNYTQREIDWLNSDEYIKRNMAATGKSREAVIKERDKIFKQIDKTTLNILDDKADLAAGVYAQNKNNPLINLFNTGNEEQMLNAADHEIKHAISQQAIRSADGLIDLVTNPYKKYPTVNVKKWYDNFVPGETTSKWASKAPEQQVVSKRIMDLVEKTQGIKRGTQLTNDNIKGLTDLLNKEIKNGNPQNSDIIAMLSSFKSKFGKNYYPKIKDMVNNAYGLAPFIGIGGAGVLGVGALQAKDKQKYADGGLMETNPELANILKGLKTTAGGAFAGGSAGLGLGATVGGLLGTVVPGVGNAVGAVAGASMGAVGGGLLGGLGGATKSLFSHGGQLTEINTGGTHQENPNGGVPVMNNKLVEEGETIFNSTDGKYVFSDRLMKDNKTFADLSKNIEKRYSKRPDDKLSIAARKRELSALMLEQEANRVGKPSVTKMADGGALGGLDFNKILENLGLLKVNQKSLDDALKFKTDFSNDQNNTTLDQDIAGGIVQNGDKNSKLNNEVLYDINLSNLKYLPQAAGSLFNIAKGIGSNKQINYKGIKPKLNTSNYNLTSNLTNLNNDSAGVNKDIRSNSNLTAGQKISALGSVAANTQKNKADMTNQINFANTSNNLGILNNSMQYNAGVFDRNIDENERYQDARASSIKVGLDTLGQGANTVSKDMQATANETANNKMLSVLLKNLYKDVNKNNKLVTLP